MLAVLAAAAAADPLTPEEGEQVLATLAGTWPAVRKGLPATVRIAGRDLVTKIDRTEEHATIRVVSPCSLLVVNDDGAVTATPFVVHEGKVHLFDAFAVQRGESVWMCHGAEVAELRADGACARWTWWMDGDGLRWAEDEATCARDGTAVTRGIVPAPDPATGRYRDTIRFEDRGGGVWSAAPLLTELPSLPAAPSDLSGVEGGPVPKTKKKKDR